LVGQQAGHLACKKLCGAGMVICLKRRADLHMVQLMPLPLTVSSFSKIQIGFTFLVVLEKGPLNGCVYQATSLCIAQDAAIVTIVAWSVYVSVVRERELCKNN